MNFKRRRKKNQVKRKRRFQADYQKLEPRQLLAVEVGLNFTGTVGEIESSAFKPNQTGAVGPDHIVEVVNDRFVVYDKAGTELAASSLTEFWTDAGASVLPLDQPRVLFDADTDRFFISSVGVGTGNTIFLGVSDSDDPTGGWQSAQFTTAPGQSSIDSTLSVDAAGLYVTTTNLGGGFTSSIFSVPKEDMLLASPDLINMTRFEGLDRSMYGEQIQVAFDVSPTATRAISLSTFASGNTIVRTDVIGSVGPAATLTTPIEITVPNYVTAPDARQPGGLGIEHTSPYFSGNVIRKDGYLYAVHTIRGTGPGNSAIRWYKIDDVTNEVVEHGTFEDSSEDYINPSIAVNDYGVISIGYTTSGLAKFPSAYAVMGYTETGLTTPKIVWQDPIELRAGLDNYEAGTVGANDWSDYSSTQVDPVDPFAFYTFQEYASTNDRWSIRISETGVFDLNPTIRGDAGDNVVIVRAVADNPDWLEVEFDGVVTDTFEIRSLNTLNVNGMGGDDVLVLDYTNGNPNPLTGVTLRGGDGFDSVQTIGDTFGHDYVIDGDGRGYIDGGQARFRDVEQIFGSFFADSFKVLELTTELTIRAGLGDDLFEAVEPVTGTLNLYGEQGDDSYRLGLLNLSRVNVFDSEGFENDIVVAVATVGNDEIIIDGTEITLNGASEPNFVFTGIETLGVDGLKGDDSFFIQDTEQYLILHGSEGRDSFYISSDAPNMSGDTSEIADVIEIDGGIGQNQLRIGGAANLPLNATVTEDSIMGMTAGGLVTYTATGGSFAKFNDVAGIILTGSQFSDVFHIDAMLRSNFTVVEAGDGNDIINVDPSVEANLYLDGQGGTDTYNLTMQGITSRTTTVADTGGGDRDRIDLKFTDNDDVVRVAFGNINFNAEKLITGFQTEVMLIDTMDGDDLLQVERNTLSYLNANMGMGDDTINVEGSRGIDSALFEMGDGDDDVNFNISSNQSTFSVDAGAGDDDFHVSEDSFADVVYQGGEGTDVSEVFSIGRTDRYVAVRDDGVDGDDDLTVYGVFYQDRFTIAPLSVQNRKEVVAYDAGIDNMLVDAAGGPDIITVTGSVAGRLMVYARTGNDLIFVENTSMADRVVVDAGAGNDTFNITGSAAGSFSQMFGQGGDDLFIVGSLPADDTGNLNRVRGRVNLIAGGDINQDRLYVNDNAATGAYGYYVSQNVIGNLDGQLLRPNFAGIGINPQMEFVRVDGTDQANFFSVVPSQFVQFHIDGNLPENVGQGDLLNLLGGNDGRSLTGGVPNGMWTFTNGNQNVSYENIEFLAGAGVGNIPLPGGGGSGGSAKMMRGDDNGGDDKGDDLKLAGSQGLAVTQKTAWNNDTEDGKKDSLDQFFANQKNLVLLGII